MFTLGYIGFTFGRILNGLNGGGLTLGWLKGEIWAVRGWMRDLWVFEEVFDEWVNGG